MGGKPDVRVRRVYDDPEPDDGTRVLVDRIWPRGLTKDKARLDQWSKQVAPSTQLRKWYSHDPERFEEFDRRYREELKACRDQPGRRACRPDQGERFRLNKPGSRRNADVATPRLLSEGDGRVGDPIGQPSRG